MIDIVEEDEPSGEVRDLHACSDEELDLLPYGVIALDTSGVVRRYNRVEARFARLDRSLVIGRPFFGVIAPCTATPEFEGRFRAFIDDPAKPRRVRFSYVFNFRFGAQEVDIELLRSSSPTVFYFCVGRRKFRGAPVRAVPGGALDGVAVAELAPDERRLGVRRDELERRNVVLDGSFLEALVTTLRPEQLTELGVAWGRRVAIELEADAAESFDGTLGELPIVTAMELLAQYVKRQGWGHLVVDLGKAKSGLVTFSLERSALAETGASPAPRCAAITGLLRALLSHIAGRPLAVREVLCKAQGETACTFVATGSARLDELAPLGVPSRSVRT